MCEIPLGNVDFLIERICQLYLNSRVPSRMAGIFNKYRGRERLKVSDKFP